MSKMICRECGKEMTEYTDALDKDYWVCFYGHVLKEEDLLPFPLGIWIKATPDNIAKLYDLDIDKYFIVAPNVIESIEPGNLIACWVDFIEKYHDDFAIYKRPKHE